jgi:hypothetical protein
MMPPHRRTASFRRTAAPRRRSAIARRAAGVLAGAMLAAGCAAPDGPPDDAGAPGDPEAPGELVASCGSVRFDTVPADFSRFPPVEDIAAHVDLAALGMEASMFEEYAWFIADESPSSVVLFGIPPRPPREGPPYASAELRRDGDRWQPRSWGQCRIAVSAPGWGNAHFVLDPEREPDPDSPRVHVLAWENGCASGQAPDGREVRAVPLHADEHRVSVVILVEPVSGAAACPGNPAFPLEIVLDGPLGDRTVYDAATDPALARPWPPTPASLGSDGRQE